MGRCRCVSESGLPAIRDITHIVGAVLDAPMATIEVQQVLRTGFGGSQRGDEIDDLGAGLGCLGHGAGQLSDLRDTGPGRGQIGIHRSRKAWVDCL